MSCRQVDEILDTFATVDDGGVYHISERGDRLIDLAAFRDALWQVCDTSLVVCSRLYSLNTSFSEVVHI